MAKIIPVETFDCVVFGATGDLTLRKLLPALYYRCHDGQVPEDSRIIGVARSDLDDKAYRDRAAAALKDHVAARRTSTKPPSPNFSTACITCGSTRRRRKRIGPR